MVCVVVCVVVCGCMCRGGLLASGLRVCGVRGPIGHQGGAEGRPTCATHTCAPNALQQAPRRPHLAVRHEVTHNPVGRRLGRRARRKCRVKVIGGRQFIRHDQDISRGQAHAQEAGALLSRQLSHRRLRNGFCVEGGGVEAFVEGGGMRFP